MSEKYIITVNKGRTALPPSINKLIFWLRRKEMAVRKAKRAPFVFADSNAEWIYEWSLRRRRKKTNKRRTNGLRPAARAATTNQLFFLPLREKKSGWLVDCWGYGWPPGPFNFSSISLRRPCPSSFHQNIFEWKEREGCGGRKEINQMELSAFI